MNKKRVKKVANPPPGFALPALHLETDPNQKELIESPITKIDENTVFHGRKVEPIESKSPHKIENGMISGGEILFPILHEDYKKVKAGLKENPEVVGCGRFARVFRVDDMAIKQIFVEEGEQQELYIEREMQNLQSINNPFVIKFRGAYRNEAHECCLILDFMDAGALRSVMKKCGKLPELVISQISFQMLIALHCLSQKNMVHRDIKPENILLNFEGNAKLSDFGLSKKSSPTHPNNSYVGTGLYMSPERLYEEDKINCSSDLWSLGLVVAECALGRFPLSKSVFANPFLMKDYFMAIHDVLTEKLQKCKCSPELLEFALNCCHFESSKRLTPVELLKLKFITKYNNVPDDVNEIEWESVKQEDVCFPDIKDWLIECKNKLLKQQKSQTDEQVNIVIGEHAAQQNPKTKNSDDDDDFEEEDKDDDDFWAGKSKL